MLDRTVLIDEGCSDCGRETALVGVFPSKQLAGKVKDTILADRNKKGDFCGLDLVMFHIGNGDFVNDKYRSYYDAAQH